MSIAEIHHSMPINKFINKYNTNIIYLKKNPHLFKKTSSDIHAITVIVTQLVYCTLDIVATMIHSRQNLA